MSHYIDRCEHGTVLGQCRCPSPDKTQRTSPCPGPPICTAVGWYALLCVEGLPTTDSRIVEPGALRWTFDYRQPNPVLRLLMSSGATAVGGEILSLARSGRFVTATGRFADSAPGILLAEVARAAAREGKPLGIGLDLHTDDSAIQDTGEGGEVTLRISRARVLGATAYMPNDGVVPAWPQCALIPYLLGEPT